MPRFSIIVPLIQTSENRRGRTIHHQDHKSTIAVLYIHRTINPRCFCRYYIGSLFFIILISYTSLHILFCDQFTKAFSKFEPTILLSLYIYTYKASFINYHTSLQLLYILLITTITLQPFNKLLIAIVVFKMSCMEWEPEMESNREQRSMLPTARGRIDLWSEARQSNRKKARTNRTRNFTVRGYGKYEPEVAGEQVGNRLRDNSNMGLNGSSVATRATTSGDHGQNHQDNKVLNTLTVPSRRSCLQPSPHIVSLWSWRLYLALNR